MIAAILVLAQAALDREGVTVPLPGAGWSYAPGGPSAVRVVRASDGLAFTVKVVVDDAPFDDAMRARLRKVMGEILHEGRGRHGRHDTWWVEYEIELEKVGARNKSVWVDAGKRRVLFHFYVPRDRWTPETAALFDAWVERCAIAPDPGARSIPVTSWVIAAAGVLLSIVVMILVRRGR